MPEPTEHRDRAGAEGASRAIGWIGRIGAPLAAIVVYLLLPSAAPGVPPDAAQGLSDAGRSVAAVGVLLAVLWMTEALPLPATALLPIALFPLTGALKIKDAAAPYADPVIFLFMGGFILALAMERWGLHRRLALRTVLLVGTKPTRLVGGFMLATAALSMWMSNTATTVMMLPIGVTVITLTLDSLRETGHDLAYIEGGEERPATGEGALKFATCLMLGIAYAANIGGVATLIGTPPNAFLAGFLRETYGVELGFGRWMLVGAPLAAVFLVITWFLLTRILYPPRLKELPGGRALISGELKKLGPMSRGEWTVLGVFLATATAWVVREPLTNWTWLVERVPTIRNLDDSGIAIIAAMLLFAIPVNARKAVFTMNWETAVKLPWGVLLLFGGGLSLATAVRTTGVDAWIGHQVGALGGLPTVALVVVVVAVVIFLTEMTSNTATAATFLPILGGVAVGLGISPMLLVVPAALAASCAFMLPVATPPNAIVFGSGHVTIAQMVKAGFWLNLLGVALITGAIYTVGAWVLL